MMLDRREQSPFTIDDVYSAADQGSLVDLFLTIDDSGIIELWANKSDAKAEMERAFQDAAEALRGREMRKTGVGENALCLTMAIMLEAIQQQFHNRNLA